MKKKINNNLLVSNNVLLSKCNLIGSKSNLTSSKMTGLSKTAISNWSPYFYLSPQALLSYFLSLSCWQEEVNEQMSGYLTATWG